MKKLLITVAISTLISHAALADSKPAGDFFFKPYVGANYDYVSVNYQGNLDSVLKDSIHGGDLHVGARIHKYVGIEASYLLTQKAEKNNVLGSGINTGVKIEGGTFDVLGYAPVTEKFEVIGTVGLSVLKATADLNGAGGAASSSETEVRGRFGGGAQYWVTDNLNIRGLVRYQDADFGSVADNAVITSIGVNWQF